VDRLRTEVRIANLDAQTNYYRALADLNVARAACRLAVGEAPEGGAEEGTNVN